ncbi:MAG: hypothetical protein ABI162_11915 [Luteolibacter sp.]
MSQTDTTTQPANAGSPAPAPSAEANRSRGYFHQGQLDDLDTTTTVLAAARSYPEEMTSQDISATWLDDFAAILKEARRRSSSTGQDVIEAKQATQESNDAQAKLVAGLKRIQSAAKQKHQMLAEDGDPATNFPTDGYLIGTRLDASRAILIQSADSLIARAEADSLPGFKTPDKIAVIEELLAAYTGSKDGQQGANRDKELGRLSRDELIGRINARRAATQHAADALWPPTEANRPIRKTF